MKTLENKLIEICDVDYLGQYKFQYLFSQFTQLATQSANELGMWTIDMIDKYGWVLAKQTLIMNEPIMLGDMIDISTDIGKSSFVAFPRYYYIYKKQKEIGYCSSLWTLIDIQKRSIVSPKKIGITIPTGHQQLPTPETIHPDIPLTFQTKRQVLYSDVDTNQHMNNARYIEWALDLLDFDMYQDYFIHEISVNYKKEIRPLEYVDLYLGHQDNVYIIEGKNDENTFFVIKIGFLKK